MLKSRRRHSWLCCALGRNNITTNPPSQNWKRILPGLLVSLVALAAVFSLVDFDQFVIAVQQADLRFLGASVLVSLLWLAVRGLVWRTLLQEKATYRDVFLTLNEGYLLNNILPFRLGEVGRAFLLGRKANLDFWHVLPTILIERALDLALAVGIFLSALPFVVGVTWARQAAMGTGIMVGAGLLSIYLLARNRQRVVGWVERAGGRWSIVQRFAGQRLAAFFDGLQILIDLKRFLRALGWMGFNWLLGIAQYYMFLRVYFPQTEPLWAVFVLGCLALGVAAPSSPGAVGVFEAALVGGLTVFDVEPSTAAAFALTTHVIGYLLTGLLGGYALSRDGETLSSLYSRLGKMKTENQPPAMQP